MKILSYSTYFYPYISGITIYQVRLWNRLIKKNKITVLTFPVKYSSPSIYIDKKINIINMPYILKISKGFISLQSIYYFFNECRKSDVIILNLPNFEAFPLALIAKFMRKKIISIFQCEVFLGEDLISKIIMLCLNISMDIQLSLSNAILVLPGYTEKGRIKKKWGRKMIPVIPPIEELYVNKSEFLKYKREKGSQKWIGFFGRISREKGIQYLIQAISKINNSSLELILVGPSGKEVIGEKKYYNKILSLLNKKNIPYKIHGLLEEKKLGALIKNLDLLVLPSTDHTEAFGMVQAEAMLLGVPVVASNMPGVSFPIKTTGMGELAKIKDANDLSEKIQKVLINKKNYLKKKHEIKKYFDADKSSKIIEKIIKNNNHSSFFEKS